MNVFYDVPKVNQVEVVSNWLRPRDVCRLDIATCCHKYRKDLLELLKSPECVLGYFEFGWDWISSWVILREIKSSYISLDIKVLAEEHKRKGLLKVMGATLTTLELMCGNYEDDSDDEYDSEYAHIKDVPVRKIMEACATYCSALESLYVNGGQLDRKLANLIQSNPKLKHIHLKDCTKVNPDIMDAVIISPSLETFELDNCTLGSATLEDFLDCTRENETCTSVVLTSTTNPLPGVFAVVFPNVVDLHISIESGGGLAFLSSVCTLVKRAKVKVDGELTMDDATIIVSNWPHIESLEILNLDSTETTCEQDVALLFVDRCLSLTRLVLAPMQPTHTYVEPALHTSSAPLASKIRELSVSELNEEGLVHILDKCPDLYALSLHNPEPVEFEVGGSHAEFALHRLQHSSVKALQLSNVLNFGLNHLFPLRGLHSLVLNNVGSEAELETANILCWLRVCPMLDTLCIYDCETIDYSVVLAALPIARRLGRLEYYTGPKTPIYEETPVASMLACMVHEKYPNMRRLEVHIESV